MQRLKTRVQFQAAMAGGTVARTPHFALHSLALPAKGSVSIFSEPEPGSLAPPPGPQALFSVAPLWLGAMAPKRWARRAVTRNAIKRQIYNVALVFAPNLPPAAYVVRLRATFDRKQFTSASSALLKQAVRAELLQLFQRVAKASPPLVRAAA